MAAGAWGSRSTAFASGLAFTINSPKVNPFLFLPSAIKICSNSGKSALGIYFLRDAVVITILARESLRINPTSAVFSITFKETAIAPSFKIPR